MFTLSCAAVLSWITVYLLFRVFLSNSFSQLSGSGGSMLRHPSAAGRRGLWAAQREASGAKTVRMPSIFWLFLLLYWFWENEERNCIQLAQRCPSWGKHEVRASECEAGGGRVCFWGLWRGWRCVSVELLLKLSYYNINLWFDVVDIGSSPHQHFKTR